jgi:3-phosphoshikimate 1-carboxyvinyltransferase
VLRALGVEVSTLGERTTVRGVGLRGLRESATPLDCGNSGTTTRLMSGVLAGQPITSTLVGDASLSRRPMRRVSRPLAAMGARIEFPARDGTLPMRISGGALRSIEWTNDPPSAQVKSAVLLAGLVGGAPVTVREDAPTRDHTEQLLRALGVRVASEDGVVALTPTDSLESFDFEVPGDPSSAAFLVAAAILGGSRDALRVEGVNLNETRVGFYRVLRRMGADIDLEIDRADALPEPAGTIRAGAGPLKGATVGGAEVPTMVDELPLLACVATRANGETVIREAAELRVKESDRIRAVVSNLRAIGAEAEELDDGMRIVGTRGPLRGMVSTEGDHRIAMAFGVLGALPGNDVRVDDPSCVDISYPRFWSDLARVAG